jgi:hypothetical protein
MKRILTLIISFAFVFASFATIAAPTFALESESLRAQDDWDWDSDWDDDWWDDTDTGMETTYQTDFEGSEELGALLGGATAIFGGIMLLFSLVLGLGAYIFTALALMALAKRLGYENGWFAWIPLLNLALMFKMGDMNPLLVLLALIPGIGGLAVGIIAVIALMNICEKRGYERLLGLLFLVPLANIVLLGILAWGKKDSAPKQTPVQAQE